MLVLLIGTGMFALAFAVHVLLWRVRTPRRQLWTLIMLFLLVSLIGSALLLWFGAADALIPAELVLALVLFGSYCAIYLILFSALEADSPTLTIIGLIERSGKSGISREDLSRAMATRAYIPTRVQQMINDGMAICVDDRIYAGVNGQRLVSLILFLRRLLNRPESI